MLFLFVTGSIVLLFLSVVVMAVEKILGCELVNLDHIDNRASGVALQLASIGISRCPCLK